MSTQETQQATENGTAPAEVPTPEPTFPVGSFRDAAPHLRRPFTERAVKFKVQSDWEGGAMIVAYIDARLVVERLNLVCPHLWHDEYDALDGGRMMCILTVDGIARPDIGEGYQGKGLYSDALKRAGVKFGVGVSLYAIPRIYLKTGAELKQKKRGQKLRSQLTDAGEKLCRKRYLAWLKAEGIAHFGQPLDHGDAENSVGDAEANGEPSEAAQAESTPPGGTTKKRATELVERALSIGVSSEKVGMWFTAKQVEYDRVDTKGSAVEALRSLTPELAEEFEAWLSGQVDAGEQS